MAEQTVEHHYEVRDLQAYLDKAYSALRLISEAAFQRGIEQMQADLGIGPIPGVSRYVLLWGMK